MAPIHESVVELSAASPLMVTFLVAMVSLAVLASLLVAALVCACGKRKEQPTVGEEPQEDLKPPEEEPVMMESSKPQDEAKSAKTALEGLSRSEPSIAKINPDKAPALQLTSQKPAPEGISAVGNMKPTDRAPSLKLTGSPDSSSVQPEKGSEASLQSKTVGSKKTVPKKSVESKTAEPSVGVPKMEPKAVVSRSVGPNVVGAKPVGDKSVGSRTVGPKVVGKHSVLVGV